ncbi:hypothetical protein [Bacillus cereus group sp. BfR-BA-01309]|uniref:hypothetical protein n=1 Tax=Bacillus cereus group sp. BfR-BA-01309 TaxID=2920286 RepID=UPI001F59CE24|nr:hypothetical protein [Bacillus cereus group sp. BfR-BA-01309]
MTTAIEFIGNALKTLGPLAIVLPFIFGYIYKNDLDITFEQKQGRFFKKFTSFITAFFTFYFLMQIMSLALYSLITALPFLSHLYTMVTAIIIITAASLIYILYIYAWPFTQVEQTREFTQKKKYKFAKWVIDKLEQWPLFTTVCIVFFTCSYFHALQINTLFLNSKNISKTFEDNIMRLIGDPVFFVLFTGSVVFLFRLNKRPKQFYTMSLIDYATVQKNTKDLIHLYTRKDTQWVLVEPKHHNDLKEVYIYNPDKDKWYFYKKVNETELNS